MEATKRADSIRDIQTDRHEVRSQQCRIDDSSLQMYINNSDVLQYTVRVAAANGLMSPVKTL